MIGTGCKSNCKITGKIGKITHKSPSTYRLFYTVAYLLCSTAKKTLQSLEYSAKYSFEFLLVQDLNFGVNVLHMKKNKTTTQYTVFE
jgi:hypothetical protein